MEQNMLFSDGDLPSPAHPDDGLVTLKGALERIVFHNDENGYTIFRLRDEDTEDLHTVVGAMPSPRAGSSLLVRGTWTTHPQYGRQLNMQSAEEALPTSREGIRLFLASGCIKGIGPKWAERIVSRFGVETLDVLDNEPERLLEIPKFPKRLLDGVKDAWAEQKGVRDLMIFLQPHGLGPSYAARIYKYYGNLAMAVVQENPYRLAMDIHGIGFTTADNLALRMGFTKDHPLRAEAGVLYVLMKQSDDGHVYFPKDKLLAVAAEQLEIDPDMADNALRSLWQDERIIIEDFGDHEGVYLSKSHHYESRIAFYIKRLLHSPKSVRFENATDLVQQVIARQNITLAPEQEEAVHTATKSKVMVLTGGPGTGKTTIINTIIQVFESAKAKILLAAPTGRAAKRMSETSGREAKTIHRLLEYSPGEDGFKKNENNPLACSLLVIDEASMMDTMLMYQLVKAAPLGATFILVGDVNQLPSVGPGNVLNDVIQSGVVPVVRLMEVFRQAATSDIVCNAHLINKGEMPFIRKGLDTDFFFFKTESPDACAETVIDLVQNRIPQKFHFHPKEDIQVLSPMLKGTAGVRTLNSSLQKALNPKAPFIQRGDTQFRLHDKVMQIKNNYDKDIYNGDIGTITFLDTEDRTLSIRMDDRVIPYLYEELDELVLAYAISVHKSQGGEYPVVVIPLLTQHYMLLQRNLVYTAITRGKKMVVLVGEYKALAMAVANNKIRKRYTRLAERLREGVEMQMPLDI